MRNKRHLSIFMAVTAAALLAVPSVRASETDERIEASAQSSYVFKTYLKDDGIRTASKDGVVTLSGTVTEQSHRSLAQETVASLPGVKSVNNELKVSNQDPDEGTDAWLGMRVKAALLFHRNVSAIRTKVDVKDAVVTLSGEADNQAEKDLAGEYASDIEGVKSVKNDMTIASGPKATGSAGEKIDDASITAQAKLALLSRYSTSALRTKVSTDAGVVTVSGKAKNNAEKDLVTKLVSDINGVNSVTNNMEVVTP